MISVSNVSKYYGTVKVLSDCSTRVEKAEVIVICGPSGSGKSTLIKCINGLERFHAGEIVVNGVSVGARKTDLPKLRSQIGMVFQHFELFLHRTVLDNLTLAQTKVLGRTKKVAAENAERLLDRVGVREHALKYPGQLSGGQQQRVAIARALVGEPTLVLADEPTANLDSRTGQEVIDLMHRLNRERGTTFVFSTHDPRIMAAADRVLEISDGRLR